MFMASNDIKGLILGVRCSSSVGETLTGVSHDKLDV